MKILVRQDIKLWAYLAILVSGVALSMIMATPHPIDDHFAYQRFIEALAGGVFDLSIPGFHGMNILTVPWYLISRSEIAQIEFQMLAGVLLPFCAYLAASSLFGSRWHGMIFATIIALMPFLSFSALRGWMVAIYNCLFFLTIYGAVKNAKWTWFTWGFSIISLPFSLALLPLLVVLTPVKYVKKDLFAYLHHYRYIVYGLLIPAVYVLIQIAQVGQVNVGVHEEFNQWTIWQGPERMFLNLAHSLQIMFSVHNYYFIDPAKTGHGNLMHTTPILIFLGLLAFCNAKTYFKKQSLPLALFLGAVIGIGLNVMLDHMDDFYMETGIFFIILAALPVLKSMPVWIPLVLATLHFQWMYFYLQHGSTFQLDYWFFVVPLVVDVCFIGWCIVHVNDIIKECKKLVSLKA
jgi:hypothetical protein